MEGLTDHQCDCLKVLYILDIIYFKCIQSSLVATFVPVPQSHYIEIWQTSGFDTFQTPGQAQPAKGKLQVDVKLVKTDTGQMMLNKWKVELCPVEGDFDLAPF